MKRGRSIFLILVLVLFLSSFCFAVENIEQRFFQKNIGGKIYNYYDGNGLLNSVQNETNLGNNYFQNIKINDDLEVEENQVYIIELKEPSVVEKSVAIDKEIKQIENQISSAQSSGKTSEVASLQSNLNKKENEKTAIVTNYRRDLKASHRNALLDIEGKLEKRTFTGNVIYNIRRITGRVVSGITGMAIFESSLKPENEFYNTINAVVLNISKEQAENIKKSNYVKEVYPNGKVYATLMDSVPLIGANEVWNLDADGNDCKVSGKECLTGKNITIGIIDTGVDYTHPDLSDTLTARGVFYPKIYGNYIAWLEEREGIFDIYLYDLRTMQSRVITESNSNFSRDCGQAMTKIDIFEDLVTYNDCKKNPKGFYNMYMYNISSGKEKIINEFGGGTSPKIEGDNIIWIGKLGSENDRNYIMKYSISQDYTSPILSSPGGRVIISSPEVYKNVIVWTEYNPQTARWSVTEYNIASSQKKNIFNDSNPTVAIGIYNDLLALKNSLSQRIYFYNLTKGEIKEFIKSPTNSSISEEMHENQVVLTGNNSGIYVYNLLTKQMRQLYSGGAEVRDSTSIYQNFVVFREKVKEITNSTAIYLYNLLNNEIKIISEPAQQFAPGSYPNNKVFGGYDFVNNDEDPMDDHGHGTHVAATAAGNGILKGVAPDAKIYAYKVLDQSGSGYWNDIIAAIENSVDPNNDGDFSDHLGIISMSLGGWGSPDDVVSRAVDNAVEAGVTAVIAAGNSGPSMKTIGSPGTARKAITVGATDKNDEMAYFSSRGPVEWKNSENEYQILIKPDVVAPGVSICAAEYDIAWQDRRCLDDKHVAISGTSMATPHVSGAVALIKQAHPDWNPEEIKAAVRNTALNVYESILGQGYGRINVLGAVKSKIPPIAKLDLVKFTLDDFENGGVSGKINITGTAKSENFKEYKLFYKENTGEFINFYNSSVSVDNSTLYENFDTTILNDGESFIALEVYSNEGVKSIDTIMIKVENIILTSPFSGDIFRLGDKIEINGSILFVGDYNLEYSTIYSEEWRSEGISKSVEIGKLGEWDTSVLNDSGFYSLRIRVMNREREIKKEIASIYIDKSLKIGWPQRVKWESYEDPRWGRTNYWGGYIEPVASDVDGDGKKEIFTYFGGNPPKIMGFKSDGSPLTGWPAYVEGVDWPGGNLGPITIADVDGDGKKEIVVNGWDEILRDGALYVYSYKGELLRKIYIGGWLGNGITTIIDLNQDEISEIIRTYQGEEDKKYITVLNLSGKVINEGWPKEIYNNSKYDDFHYFSGCQNENYGQPITVGDIDGDDQDEIIVISGENYFVPDFNPDLPWEGWYCRGKLFAFEQNGSLVEGFPRVLNMTLNNPAIADLDKDGKNEIIITTLPSSDLWENNGFLIFNGSGDIKLKSSLKNKQFSLPAIFDYNNDGYLEMALSSFGIPAFTYVFNSTGDLLEGWPQETLWVNWFGPVIGDVDGDRQEDIIATAGDGFYPSVEEHSGVYAWNISGSLIEGFPKVTEVDVQAAAAITDINNDGKLDLIASSDWDYNPIKRWYKMRGSIYVWELNSLVEEQSNWYMMNHDTQRTGNYNFKEQEIERGLHSSIEAKPKIYVEIPTEIKVRFVNPTLTAKNFNYSLSVSKCDSEGGGCSEMDLIFERVELNASQSYENNATFTAWNEGEYNLTLEIWEDGKENSTKKYFITNATREYADVHILDYDDSNYQDFYLNEEGNFSLSIRNRGGYNAENVNVSIYESGSFEFSSQEKGHLIGSYYLNSLEAKKSENITIKVTPLLKGYNFYFIKISADNDNIKQNNRFWVGRRAINRGIDIAIENIYPGDTLVINHTSFGYFDFDNFGDEDALNSTISIFLDGELIKSEIIENISKSEYWRTGTNFNFIPTKETFNLTAKIEADEDVDLSDNIKELIANASFSKKINMTVLDSLDKNVSRYLITELYDEEHVLFTGNKTFEMETVGNENYIFIANILRGNISNKEEYFELVGTSFNNANLSDNEKIISEYYESINQDNENYYFVYANNASFGYERVNTFLRFDEDTLKSKGIDKIEDYTIYFCNNFDFSVKKCLNIWREAEWVDIDENEYKNKTKASYEGDSWGKIEAFALSESQFSSETTDLTQIPGDSANNVTFDKRSHGKIKFLEEVNIARIKYDKKMMKEAIKISRAKISINTTLLPEFANKSAEITFRDIELRNPKIRYNGESCPSSVCNFEYNSETKTLVMNVAHFSEFEVVEGEYCGDSICNNQESCSSCSYDCGNCGGGGGSRCTPLWNCTYTPCVNYQQHRICTKINSCNSNWNRPAEDVRNCFNLRNCTDNDLDGYGVGSDCFGADLNDNNPGITNIVPQNNPNNQNNNPQTIEVVNTTPENQEESKINTKTMGIIIAGIIVGIAILIIIIAIIVLTKNKKKARSPEVNEKAVEIAKEMKKREYSYEKARQIFKEKGWSEEEIHNIMKRAYFD